MHLDMDIVHWAGSIKYLGVHINGVKNLSFDIHTFRRSFYAAFNNIHGHAKALEEPVQLKHLKNRIPSYRTQATTGQISKLPD